MLLPLILAAATAGAAPPRVITNPDWAARPTVDRTTLLRLYPPLALIAEQHGETIIDCLVRANGSVRNCTVESEKPADWGFGEAALTLAPSFRMKPKTLDGEPIDGAMVRIPLAFHIQGDSDEVTAFRCYGALAGSADPADIALAAKLSAGLRRAAANAGASARERDDFLARAVRQADVPDAASMPEKCRLAAAAAQKR